MPSTLTLCGTAVGQFGGDFQSTIHQKPLPHLEQLPVALTIEAHDKGNI